jgi:hypothetical protein
MVVDSTGSTIGTLIGNGQVALATTNGKVWARFGYLGFSPSESITYYHTTPDCSDTATRYLDANDVPVPAPVMTDSALIPIFNHGILTFRSKEVSTADSGYQLPAPCTPIADYITLGTGYIEVPLSQLGTPPFSIQ